MSDCGHENHGKPGLNCGCIPSTAASLSRAPGPATFSNHTPEELLGGDPHVMAHCCVRELQSYAAGLVVELGHQATVEEAAREVLATRRTNPEARRKLSQALKRLDRSRR